MILQDISVGFPQEQCQFVQHFRGIEAGKKEKERGKRRGRDGKKKTMKCAYPRYFSMVLSNVLVLDGSSEHEGKSRVQNVQFDLFTAFV